MAGRAHIVYMEEGAENPEEMSLKCICGENFKEAHLQHIEILVEWLGLHDAVELVRD